MERGTAHDAYVESGQVKIDQNAFYPFFDDLTNQAKIPPFPRPPGSVGERGVGF